jgi:uncharacterized protein YbaP (TraB family)
MRTAGRKAFESMLKSVLHRALSALGLATLLVGAPAASKTPQAQPALWEVSDHDTTIYLFGTIHLLPKDYQWRTSKFDQALNGSQELVVETVIDEKDPGKLMAAIASLGFAEGLPPLAERVPAEKRAALQAAIARTKMPPAAFDRMKTWTAAFLLMGDQFKDMGLKGGDGVEAVLRNKFLSEGKSVGELESNVEQLTFFNALPEGAQRALLEGALEPAQGGMDKQFSAMLRAWASGDVSAVAKTFDQDMSSTPDLQKILIAERNQNWSRWIGKRMAQPGAVMVAVGAGHLAGKYSLVSMLKRDGYRVRRLQ